jgi:alanyl-tRNA synthetase
VVKYRLVKSKGKDQVQIVLAETPFYAESGGQVGDRGHLQIGDETVAIVDTKKDNDLIIHFAESLPLNLEGEVTAEVNAELRRQTTLHHSVTHLLHAALRTVLGKHVAQKGSLNNENGLRFDFSHFSKMTADEGMQVEQLVNRKIRENHPVIIKELPKEEALLLGATALFGEKYGDVVRVVIMDENYSIELCGGTHVGYTGELGFFKITGETAVAAGVRRIEALCGEAAEQYIGETEKNLLAIKAMFKNPNDIVAAIENQQNDLADLRKKIEGLEARQLVVIRNGLLQKDEIIDQVNFIGEMVEVSHPDALKKLCFDLKNHLKDFVIVLCANIDGKPFVAIAIADNVVAAKGLDAGAIIKQQIAPLIKGGGGGQKNLATAGGQEVSNLPQAIAAVRALL